MEFKYDELLNAQLRYGTTVEDIRKNIDFNNILPNVVIAPWWEVNIFEEFNLKITKINDKLYNLKKENIEFSFIEVKQIGAPSIIELILNLGVTNCKNIIFIGSAGSLTEDINIGDIVIPKLSICGDGASRYLNDDLSDDFGKNERPDSQLTNNILEITKKITGDAQIKVHNVNNFSVDTIFGQFPHIEKIKSMGAEVIEMETYALFKTAKIANIKATALFCISDNSVINKSLYSGRDTEDRKRKKLIKNEIIPKIIIEFLENNTI